VQRFPGQGGALDRSDAGLIGRLKRGKLIKGRGWSATRGPADQGRKSLRNAGSTWRANNVVSTTYTAGSGKSTGEEVGEESPKVWSYFFPLGPRGTPGRIVERVTIFEAIREPIRRTRVDCRTTQGRGRVLGRQE